MNTPLQVLRENAHAYPIGGYWLDIRNNLRSDERVWMTKSDFEAFCKLTDNTIELDTLIFYLREVSGDILYYPDIQSLRDKIFIKPKWVVDTIYKILDYDVKEKKGVFDRAHVEQVLHVIEDTKADPDEFIALMQSFELIFEAPDGSGTWIAPQYLPDDFEGPLALYKTASSGLSYAFTLHFPHYFPKSLMVRFISRFGREAENPFWWKNGILLSRPEGKALVTCDFEKGLIQVMIESKEQRFKLLQDVLIGLRSACDWVESFEVSTNGHDFCSWQEILTQRKIKNPNIESLQGSTQSLRDFEIFAIPLQVGKTPVGVFEIGFDFTYDSEYESYLDKKYGDLAVKNRTVLYFSANPQSDLKLEQEQHALQQCLISTCFDLRPWVATRREDIEDHIHRYRPELIHFAGHGGKPGIWLLNKERTPELMPIDALSILFEKYKQTIKGVILNACYTADSAKTISQHGMYVVGMDSPINDDAAIRFAVGFYKALNRSEGYEEAFESGLLLMISPEESVASRSLSLPDSAQKSCMATLWKDGKQLYPVS